MLFFDGKGKNSRISETDCVIHAVTGKSAELDSSSLYSLQTTLRLQQDRLKVLAGSTENEFLDIGSRLQDFHARTTAIGDASVTVADQLGGEEVQNNIRELGDIIDSLGDFLLQMKVETEQSSAILLKILEMIVVVDQPLTGFKKIMKVLHVLGTSTKIESARLGHLGAGFQNLADDVENLAVQINEKSARILKENIALTGKINETLARMSNIGASQRENVRQVLNKSRDSLEMITAVHRKCTEVSATTAAISSEVSRNIYEVVTSMQFHDITRQQLEHVQEALSDLESRLALEQAGDGTTFLSAAAVRETAGEVCSICRLQAAQLCHARDGLSAAVAGIVENLQSLAGKERGIALQTRQMIGVTDGAGESLFIEIERSLAQVVGLLATSAAANRNLALAVGSVSETVIEISSFVNEIEMIGEEIELIALNSQVKAALTGEEGAALGVLAEAIQRLSVDACAQTLAVTDTLREITRVTEDLSGSTATDTATGELDIEAMADRLKRLIDSIRIMSDGVMATLARTDTAVQELSNDIDNTTVGITVHEAVSTEIAEITGELERITAQAAAFAPEMARLDQAALHDRYTMQSERDVHASITGIAVERQTAAAAPEWDLSGAVATVDDDSGLGDNVELF